MTSEPDRSLAKGWCPGAFTPMMSGDGLVVRVRPVMARLSQQQVFGLCEIALELGSGLIDLTSRANLQIRGVTETDHERVLQRLDDLGLLPDEPDLEARRNFLIPPMWRVNDAAHRIALDLMQRLAEFPELPAKMGFAIDTGPSPVFARSSADFRIERTADGSLMLRADGASRGRLVTVDSAVDSTLEMAEWFVATGGSENRRMARHVSLTQMPAEWQAVLPASNASPIVPGPSELGAVFGVAFGQISAKSLMHLSEATRATAMRVTPWRMFLLEGTDVTQTSEFICDADDPLLTIDACPGTPFCTSASVETRSVARQLARHKTTALHVSGCAKGCARPRVCATTLVGRDGRFDLVQNGTPWDHPTRTGLAPDTLIDALGEL
ncbi:precorrin-3B synthase [Shimia isoporae]|uniref:Precorrin-3B synthase n=1 Tax=Shimia isoporae TaxID=647720 RepID=A0A4R1NQR8_9RHOB|nr:precorrin-3B synthase [Shimia isoporae]TCL10191.1 precorrin-3B synthase [Shimia isoporae]